MDQVKEEPVPEQSSTSNDNSATGAPATRGRGRGRARGRRVVPRQVARRKPPPGQAPKPIDEAAGRGRGRGRGRGQDAGGRGRGRGAPTHSPNAVGLGQVAPPRPTTSRIASSGGSAVSSRRSSVVSSVSIGGASAASSSYSFGHGASHTSDDVASASTSFPADMSFPSESEQLSGKKASKKNAEPLFREHSHMAPDSDDDMPDDAFDVRNRDIAPYAGHVTDNGLLLPVSLPGLRALPPEFKEFDNPISVNGKADDTIKAEPEPKIGAKSEPMEVESPGEDLFVQPCLRAESFPPGSVANAVLSSQNAFSFMQFPGLLALSQYSEKVKKDTEKATDTNSVAEALAASERLKALGVDLRLVGKPGSNLPVGKLRMYKSGRVEMVLSNGGCLELEHGINPKVCQQVMLINSKEKTCEELQNVITNRIVAVPSLATG